MCIYCTCREIESRLSHKLLSLVWVVQFQNLTLFESDPQNLVAVTVLLNPYGPVGINRNPFPLLVGLTKWLVWSAINLPTLLDIDLYFFCSSLYYVVDLSASQVDNVSGRQPLMIVKPLAKLSTILNHSGYFNGFNGRCITNCFVSSSAQNVALLPLSVVRNPKK